MSEDDLTWDDVDPAVFAIELGSDNTWSVTMTNPDSGTGSLTGLSPQTARTLAQTLGASVRAGSGIPMQRDERIDRIAEAVSSTRAELARVMYLLDEV